MSLSIVFLNTPCNASTNMILIIPWPTELPKFHLSHSKFYPLFFFFFWQKGKNFILKKFFYTVPLPSLKTQQFQPPEALPLIPFIVVSQRN